MGAWEWAGLRFRVCVACMTMPGIILVCNGSHGTGVAQACMGWWHCIFGGTSWAGESPGIGCTSDKRESAGCAWITGEHLCSDWLVLDSSGDVGWLSSVSDQRMYSILGFGKIISKREVFVGARRSSSVVRGAFPCGEAWLSVCWCGLASAGDFLMGGASDAAFGLVWRGVLTFCDGTFSVGVWGTRLVS